MGLILALARNFPDSVRQQDRANWSQQELWDKPQHLSEVNGQVLLIVGYGSIGRELAKRAKAIRQPKAGLATELNLETRNSKLGELRPRSEFRSG